MAKPRVAQAVKFERYGGTEVLELVDIAMPVPAPGEVLIEVVTAGINHIEAFVREGRLADEIGSEFPQCQGSDFAGIVRELGPGVTALRKGAEMVGHTTRMSHASWICVPAGNLVPKPRDLSWEVAGALFLAGLVAADTIDEIRLGANDTVVVSAAAGGVGSIEVQLAKALGARVIGTCGERNFDYLRQLGILPVVYGAGLAERIRALAPNGVDAYIDNFGQDDEQTAEALGVADARYRSSDDRKRLEVAAITAGPDDTAHATAQLRRLTGLSGARAVDILISGFYPLPHVRDAFDDLETLHARGKIVLGMNPVNSGRVEKARAISER